MKISTAIKTLQSWLDEQRIFPNSDLANSLRLGIDALKRLAYQRKMKDPGYSVLLPGETRGEHYDY